MQRGYGTYSCCSYSRCQRRASGSVIRTEKHCGLDDATLQRGMVVAGSIGMVINERASLAGAMGGCQAECGSAAAMAAGAAVSMLGGTPQQVGTAVAVRFKTCWALFAILWQAW